MGVGVAATAMVRYLLRRWDLEYQLAPLVLIYPCLAAVICFTIWLVFFGGR